MTRIPARLAAGLLVSLSLLGCHGLQKAAFNGGLGLCDEDALIVPFGEPKNLRFYGESVRGRIIAERIQAWAARNWSAEFREGEEVEKVLAIARDWKKERISAQDWKRLTGSLGVTYVVVGTIDELSLTSPQTIGLIDATAKVSYRVINVTTGKVAHQRRGKVVRYGNYGELGASEMPALYLGEMGREERAAELRLLAKTGEEIGKDLYGYYEK